MKNKEFIQQIFNLVKDDSVNGIVITDELYESLKEYIKLNDNTYFGRYTQRMIEIKDFINNEIKNIIDYQNELLNTFNIINDLQFIKQEYFNSTIRLYELKRIIEFIEIRGD